MKELIISPDTEDFLWFGLDIFQEKVPSRGIVETRSIDFVFDGESQKTLLLYTTMIDRHATHVYEYSKKRPAMHQRRFSQSDSVLNVSGIHVQAS